MWNRIGRDSAIFAASALLIALLQVAFRLFAIHELSVSAYGRVALLLSFFNGALILGNFGVPAAAARLAARSAGMRPGQRLIGAATRAATLPTVAASLVFGGATLAVTHSVVLASVSAAGLPPMVASVVYAGFVRGKGSVWWSAAVQPANAAAQLLFLIAVRFAGLRIGVGWVLIGFYVGNLGSFMLSLLAVRAWVNRPHRRDGVPDPEATPRRILAFSTWLSIANAALLALTIVPRVALAHVSYADVAVFDLALLIYTIPQRLTASLVIALIPVAANRQAHGKRVSVPALGDVAVLAVVCAVVDALLWWTHAVRLVLLSAGLGGYVRAEHVLLIIFLAAPAELFFGINSGLLQAFGRSRQLAAATIAVLVFSTAAAPLALRVGPSCLAGLLALDYWALYLASRTFGGEDVEERSFCSRVLTAVLRPKQVTA